MKDCKRCGKTLDDNVRFCPDCGLDQEEELKPQNNKKIGVISIIMWVFCGIFVILALAQITRFNFPAALLFLMLAFLLCPAASDILYKLTGKRIPKAVQGVLIAIVFLVVPYIRGVMIKSQNQTVAVPELTETAANTEITTEITTTEATTVSETTTEATTTTTTTTESEETTTEASVAEEEEETTAADGTKHSIDINDVKPEITSVQYGELLSVIENEVNGRSVLVIKTKIKSGISNRATITQNFFNVEDIVLNKFGYTYDEIQYWAVADMADGSESKVVSFTIDKTVIDLLYNRKIPANMLDDYASDVYILPSLLQ